MTKEEALETWLPVVEMAIVEADIPEAKEALEMTFKALEQWPCEDAISRAKLIQKLEAWDHNVNAIPNYVWMVIREEPPVTSAKKVGRWISAKVGKLFPSNDFKCSECGNILDFNGVNCGRGDANYCPNCGAKMKEIEKGRTGSEE